MQDLREWKSQTIKAPVKSAVSSGEGLRVFYALAGTGAFLFLRGGAK